MLRNNLLAAGMLSVLLATSACSAGIGAQTSPPQPAGSAGAGVEKSSTAGASSPSAAFGTSQPGVPTEADAAVAADKAGPAPPAQAAPLAAQKAAAKHPAATRAASTAAVAPAKAAPVLAASSSERFVNTVYTTAYTWHDNTPAGSAEISNPVLHKTAGGTGTFNDPVTIAVGHSLATGEDVLDFPAGTRIYLPDVRRYFIVEDTCGDGNDPENGPCHQGTNADGTNSTLWLDMWIGGQSMNASDADNCAGKLTDVHTAVFNPASNYAVAPGAGVIHDGKCDAGYGNVLVKK
jgi:hypothetical protein